jgi:hypothetical protein
MIKENSHLKLGKIQEAWDGRCEFCCVPDIGHVLIEITITCLP